MSRFDRKQVNWYATQKLEPYSFVCGHCNNQVSSSLGYKTGHYIDGSGEEKGGVYICPHCHGPTIVAPDGTRLPDVPIGNSVDHVPQDLVDLYEEARRCTSTGCYTASVLVCRKIIMHIGVANGADEGKNFLYYVDHLADAGFVPPNGKTWVDHIRKKGNEANHEIKLITRDDTRELIVFIEMLLRFIYEFPAMMP
ncbi:MAG TPA: hypothetical protein DCM07_13830 [Planctomycetaceae bacterium]|uniref:DUF4145 domain-containing protein n=1 Tax=Gimesia sp. TaxID=2024833 RepID=UPI000C38180C|nr:DUF4145 domain-containing protein [Gimesia sp.]MAX35318.1 hypothetical protein [Gimesia sp.]HAH45905.1 hypothetical protein [Planctomycetaceae bacterium]|tara:strand:+ start:309 stop:896 length:588 start_codon:yes stop_codon:yes gene_type:complete